MQALREGAVAVVSLAGGAGSRWTQGAGVVKALHPFCRLGGRHRTFIEVHLAKSRRTGRLCGTPLPHVITTSYLTHEPIAALPGRRRTNYGYAGPAATCRRGARSACAWCPWRATCALPGKRCRSSCSTSRRRRCRRACTPRSSAGRSRWAKAATTPTTCRCQCLHPVGHWYEMPNLLRNGVLARLLDERPQLKYLMVHNIDTLGADVDPVVLGDHI